MHWRGPGRQAQIAFIFQHDQVAGSGRGKIHPGDPHLGLPKAGPQKFGALAGQEDRIGLTGQVQTAGKKVGDSFPVQVHGRGGDMGRGVAGQLDDEFSQIGLGDLKTIGLKSRQ